MSRQRAIWLWIIGAVCGVLLLAFVGLQTLAHSFVKALKSNEPLTVFWGGSFTPRDEGPVKARKALIAIGWPAIPALSTALADRDALTRVNAAWAHWRISGRSSVAVPVLLDAIKDEKADKVDRCIRYDAIAALTEIGQADKDAVLPSLIELIPLGDEGAVAALQVLKRMGPVAKEAIPALIEALKDKRQGVGNCAGWAMRDMGEESVPALIDLLRDQDPSVHGMAAWVLSMMGPEAKMAVPALSEALKDPDGSTRKRAASALGAIGPEAGGAIPALIDALQDAQPDVCGQAAISLLKVDPTGQSLTTAVPALREAANRAGIYDRAAFAEALTVIDPRAAQEVAVPALIEALGHENVNDRCVVCRTLRKLAQRVPCKAAIPALRTALKDERDVRSLAALALAVIDPEGSREAILPVLLESVRNDGPECEQGAREALKNLGWSGLANGGQVVDRPEAARAKQRPWEMDLLQSVVAALGGDSVKPVYLVSL